VSNLTALTDLKLIYCQVLTCMAAQAARVKVAVVKLQQAGERAGKCQPRGLDQHCNQSHAAIVSNTGYFLPPTNEMVGSWQASGWPRWRR
jgi:hypothetical protein